MAVGTDGKAHPRCTCFHHILSHGSMSWKTDFSKAVKEFRKGNLTAALEGFTKAIENGGQAEYIIYDSRSAVLEKLGRRKDALKDAKTTIQLAPAQWQGYARAARLFRQIHKYDSAATMVDMALKKLGVDNEKRLNELLALQRDIASEQAEYVRRTTNHLGHLPVELFTDIAMLLIEEDHKQLLPLAHVCRYWRQVVWDHPHLWSTLVLGRSRPQKKAKLWIERSRGSIRSLIVKSDATTRGGWDGEGLEGLRWSQLSFCRTEDWDICKYLRSTGEIQSLSSLTHFETDQRSASTPPSLPFDLSWPLQHLLISHAPIPPQLQLHLTRTTTLLSLCLQRAVGSVILNLESHTALQRLVLNQNDGLVLSEKLPDELPDFQHMELRHVTRPYLSLLHIAMPRLETLHIDGSPFSLGVAFDSLRTKSSGHLTKIVLTSTPLSEPEKLVELLRENPSISHLQLSRIGAGVSLVVEALEPLTDSPTQASDSADRGAPFLGPMCPLLTHLDISHCPDIRTGPLVRLIKARNLAGQSEDGLTAVQTLLVDGCPQIDADWLPWFRANVQSFSCVAWSKKMGKVRQ